MSTESLIAEVRDRHAELLEWERQTAKAAANLRLAEEGQEKAYQRLATAKRELYVAITGEVDRYASPKADA